MKIFPHSPAEFDCGCDGRKEIMFLRGGASGMDVAIILGVPIGVLIYLWITSRA